MSLIQGCVAHLRRFVNTTVQCFDRKDLCEHHSSVFWQKGSLWTQLGADLFWVGSQSHYELIVCEFILKLIEELIPTGLVHIKLNSKWRPQLRPWVFTIDRISNGWSDTHQKLWHHGPACDKMEWIYVSTKVIRRGIVELTSLNKNSGSGYRSTIRYLHGYR